MKSGIRQEKRHRESVSDGRGVLQDSSSASTPAPLYNRVHSARDRLMSTSPQPDSPARPARHVLILVGIMLLAAALNLSNLDGLGSANTYYTAAVEAMRQSPYNFFFAAAEPGASVTVDKPPLGLWLQVVSAALLGVNGFAVVLPQILAGILSVPVMFALVRRTGGAGAGLIAALVMAIMPVSIAVQRNNTMDATLIFVLLLAAWAFVIATETGRLRWLLIGGVLVGLAFNIKMLQAFLPLPAFYGLYLFGAKLGWRRKLASLALTTLVLLMVSLAWIAVVDLTPADQRPYVGGSDTNSALELVIGYNGIQRLTGSVLGPAGQYGPPRNPPGSQMPAPPGGGIFGGEIGVPGPLRLFSAPLDNETGWLLPFGLGGLALLVATSRPRLPLTKPHRDALLWGGWLLIHVIFFSAATFYHAYYMAMLTPAIAALTGFGVVRLRALYTRHRPLALVLIVLMMGGTLLFQTSIAERYNASGRWLILPPATLILSIVLLIAAHVRPRLAAPAWMCAAAALTFIPAVWGAQTAMQASPNPILPNAYSGPVSAEERPAGAALPSGGFTPGVNAGLVAYLQEHTQGMRFMLAVGSANMGAGYVLATGRGVLYMGGFSGQIPVVGAEDLAALVAAGELRFVFSGSMFPGARLGDEINRWLSANCQHVILATVPVMDCAPA